MLQNNLIFHFDLLKHGRPTYFRQDCFPPHYTAVLQDWLPEKLENWIGWRVTAKWSSRLLHLNLMDFHFCVHVKQILYSTKTRDLFYLKSFLIDACQKIDGAVELLDLVYKNFGFCIDLCIAAKRRTYRAFVRTAKNFKFKWRWL